MSRRGRLRILRGAADEVLACLKNDSLTDPERKREIEKLINEVSPLAAQPATALPRAPPPAPPAHPPRTTAHRRTAACSLQPHARVAACSLQPRACLRRQVFSTLFNSDESVLIGAPTGSGKTICAEFAVLRMLKETPGGRCVYIAPLLQLAEERYADWKRTFGKLGVAVEMLCGETATDLKLLERGTIVIATPQRWDMLSRRWKQRKNVQTVSLLVVDEMHLIGGEVGPVLEVVISRMRYISSQTDNKVRILALSTSLANAKDLAEWIGCSHHGLFNFHSNVRPVPLEIHIQGYDIAHVPSRLLAMCKPAYYAVVNHAVEQPAIVFVPSAKQAQLTAVDLLTFATADDNPHRFLHASPDDIAPFLLRIKEGALAHTIAYGIAFHRTGRSGGSGGSSAARRQF